MGIDRTFVELNRESRERIRSTAAALSNSDWRSPVGEHWTPAIAMAHLAFWDRRVLCVLDMTEREGKLFIPPIDILVNDLSLPLWAAIPPHAAAAIAAETAGVLDERLERYPEDLLEQVFAYNKRWVVRALHRNQHLDDVDVALKR